MWTYRDRAGIGAGGFASPYPPLLPTPGQLGSYLWVFTGAILYWWHGRLRASDKIMVRGRGWGRGWSFTTPQSLPLPHNFVTSPQCPINWDRHPFQTTLTKTWHLPKCISSHRKSHRGWGPSYFIKRAKQLFRKSCLDPYITSTLLNTGSSIIQTLQDTSIKCNQFWFL